MESPVWTDHHALWAGAETWYWSWRRLELPVIVMFIQFVPEDVCT